MDRIGADCGMIDSNRMRGRRPSDAAGMWAYRGAGRSPLPPILRCPRISMTTSSDAASTIAIVKVAATRRTGVLIETDRGGLRSGPCAAKARGNVWKQNAGCGKLDPKTRVPSVPKKSCSHQETEQDDAAKVFHPR
jgi:hypothetical protein